MDRTLRRGKLMATGVLTGLGKQEITFHSTCHKISQK
jgi:hypothetical protein